MTVSLILLLILFPVPDFYTKQSGAWLNALPLTSLGLRLDDESVRIATGLCLGVPIAPWRMGHSLVWDATCPDTYAVSYIAHATREVLRPISDSLFCTCGYRDIWSNGALDFFKELGKRICSLTHEVKSVSYIIQHVSMEVQRRNAAAILGLVFPVFCFFLFRFIYFVAFVLFYFFIFCLFIVIIHFIINTTIIIT